MNNEKGYTRVSRKGSAPPAATRQTPPPDDKGPSSADRERAFLRHVRRLVQAQEHDFLAVIPQEMADLCQQELMELGIPDTRVSEAGVEFSGRLTVCMQVNLWSRTASRVLCRLPHFRVGVVGELFHRTAAIPWEYWLNARVPLLVQAHALRSRVDHEGLIGETIQRAVQQRFHDRGFSVPAVWTPSRQDHEDMNNRWVQRLLVRLENNRCVISLDTTGRHLHQRGYRVQHGGTPMRETLAAAILVKLVGVVTGHWWMVSVAPAPWPLKRSCWRGASPPVSGASFCSSNGRDINRRPGITCVAPHVTRCFPAARLPLWRSIRTGEPCRLHGRMPLGRVSATTSGGIRSISWIFGRKRWTCAPVW